LSLQRILWCTLIAVMVWIAMMFCEGASFRQPCAETTGLKIISCHSAPVADLELARNAAAFRNLIDQLDAAENRRWNTEVMRVNTCMDFLFIALYSLTFVLLEKNQDAEIHKLDADPRFPWWFAAVTALISLAASLDVWEDFYLLSALQKLGNSANDFIVPGDVSQAKWLFFAAAVLFLGLSFLRNRTFWSTVMSLLMLQSALLTAWGVWHTKVLPFAVASLSLALLVAVFRYFPLRPFGWKEFFACIEFTYLIRFQLVAAVLLAVLLPAGYFLAPSIFIGLFDALAFWSFVFVTAAALYMAWCIMFTIRLVFVYGRERFGGINSLPAASCLNWPTALGYAALAVPCLVMVFCGTTSLHWPYKSAAMPVGAAIAVLVLWLMARLHYWLEPDTADTACKMFPFQFLRAQKAVTPSSPPSTAASSSTSVKDGFHRDGGAGNLHSGHKLAGAALLLSVSLYALIGLAYKPNQPNFAAPAAATQVPADPTSSDSPATTLRPHATKARPPAALFYLLFLLTILVLLFSGASFLLDKVRMPVLVSALALSFLSGIKGTDHFFHVTPIASPLHLCPAHAIRAWEEGRARGDREKPMVVVATAGGGIRAAAWTAQALTGLAESPGPVGHDFSSALLLISSVSGGSVGNMFVVGSYDANGELNPDLFHGIRKASERSSLSSVGWGLLYPDFIRTVSVVGPLMATLGFGQQVDRGSALEDQWIANWRDHVWQSVPTIHQWSEDASKGNRPVAIFNATSVESGQRYLISSTVMERANLSEIQFAKDYGLYDMQVSTAARLSATFPWVSPNARASDGKTAMGVHLADGGYYDNSGILSAIQWLREAQGEIGKHPVIFIVIDSTQGPPAQGKSWSWQRQPVGPLETLLSVRDSSQVSRAKFELGLVIDDLVASCHDVRSYNLLYPPDPLTPLSWHLTEEQIDRVRQSWLHPSDSLRQQIDAIIKNLETPKAGDPRPGNCRTSMGSVR